MSWVKRIALTLVIIGAINWGLIGFFRFDLVAAIFGGQQAPLSRVIYSLVGLSGLYSLSILFSRIDTTDQEDDIRGHRLNYGTEFSDEYDFKNRDDLNKKK